MKKAINQSLLMIIINGVSILAMLFVGFWLYWYGQVSGQLSQANEERYNLTYNANRFMNGSAYLTNEVRAFAATGKQEHYDNYWNEVNNLKNRDEGVAAMQEIGLTSDEQAMIDSMHEISNYLVPLEEQAMKQVQAGQQDKAIAYVYGEEYNASIGEINTLKEQFLDDLDKRTMMQIEDLNFQVRFIRGAMLAALVMVGVIQLLSMRFNRKRILRPVIAVRDQMGQISQGNLSAEFALKSDTSEIGMLVESIHETKRELKKYINDIDQKLAQMARGNMNLFIDKDYRGEFLPIQKAMGQILDSLNDALSQINRAAGQVSIESERMALGAETLSGGTTKQAAAVEELSSSIQEISGQVNLTSEDADNARKFSLESMAQLKVCNEKMEGLALAMGDITKASNEIGGIIKTIEDISFQTNILALNASVEAARAGEAGKGFAVVAGEVKELANKSTESAQSISQLIEGSIKLVQQGSSLMEETTKALASVVSNSQEFTHMVDRIADSASHQAESLRQVTQGMDQISSVVQSNATTAEESAASAKELYSRAEELKISVQRFQLRNGSGQESFRQDRQLEQKDSGIYLTDRSLPVNR